MVILTDREKEVIKEGKRWLEANNIEGFYNYMACELNTQAVSNITNYLLEHNIPLLSYCKTEIPMCLFNGTSIRSMIIPKNINSISSYAFENCTQLTKIDIPDSVTEIGTGAFRNCSRLNEICLPNTIKRIGAFAFENCFDLKIYCEFDPREIDWRWERYKDKIIKI